MSRIAQEARMLEAAMAERPQPMSTNAKKRARRLLIERDGESCWLCGEATKPFDRTLEHLEPRSRGGTDDLDNLVLAHVACNRVMGHASKAEKFAARADIHAKAPARSQFTIAADMAFNQMMIDLYERHEAKAAATFARIDALLGEVS